MYKYGRDILKDGYSITVEMIPNPGEHFSAFTFIEEMYDHNIMDYQLAPLLGLGGASAGISAIISRNGNDYTITYRYVLYDAYNWSISASYFPGVLPTDEDIHRLHSLGLAREYFIYAETVDTYSFST